MPKTIKKTTRSTAKKSVAKKAVKKTVKKVAKKVESKKIPINKGIDEIFEKKVRIKRFRYFSFPKNFQFDKYYKIGATSAFVFLFLVAGFIFPGFLKGKTAPVENKVKQEIVQEKSDVNETTSPSFSKKTDGSLDFSGIPTSDIKSEISINGSKINPGESIKIGDQNVILSKYLFVSKSAGATTIENKLAQVTIGPDTIIYTNNSWGDKSGFGGIFLAPRSVSK